MASEIKLLHASLLDDREKLKEPTYWLRVLNRPNGWHYDLDHIWILDELERAGIRPGASIVDAGAGQGIMQYLLAARGYNVISLDFSPRIPPARSRGIFDISGNGEAEIRYQHPYMKFINYGTSQPGSLVTRLSFKKLKKIPELPGRAIRRLVSYGWYFRERFLGNHSNYGKITYVRAPFHDVPLQTESADAVISVSAIEHADIGLFDRNVNELTRLLKPGAPLLLTTSATASKENTYDEKVEGWCFSRSALAAFFPNSKIEFDAEGCARSLLNSSTFICRLDPYYYLDQGSFCYSKRILAFPYLPIAVKIVK